MKKIYKRIALAFVILTCIIVPFCFWLDGWNFERNDQGLGCVVVTILLSGLGSAIILGMGSEDHD